MRNVRAGGRVLGNEMRARKMEEGRWVNTIVFIGWLVYYKFWYNTLKNKIIP